MQEVGGWGETGVSGEGQKPRGSKQNTAREPLPDSHTPRVPTRQGGEAEKRLTGSTRYQTPEVHVLEPSFIPYKI